MEFLKTAPCCPFSTVKLFACVCTLLMFVGYGALSPCQRKVFSFCMKIMSWDFTPAAVAHLGWKVVLRKSWFPHGLLRVQCSRHNCVFCFLVSDLKVSCAQLKSEMSRQKQEYYQLYKNVSLVPLEEGNFILF